jgi:5-methylcytosine-specific restriction endonuclease McrA
VLCKDCKKREAVVGPRGGASRCEVCIEYHRNYLKVWRDGGQMVRCICGKEFRDCTGRRYCSVTCEESAQPLALELIRVCRDCGVPQPLTEEFFGTSKGRNPDSPHRWRRECRQCQRDQVRRSLATRMAEDPEAMRAYWRRRYANNPEVYKAAVRRRRARKYATRTEPMDLNAVLADLLDKYGPVCHICGWEIPANAMDFDHIVPLARGGADAADNIALAHSTCNRWKGTRLPGELDLVKRREVMARQRSLPAA